MKLFRQVVARRALERENPAIARAVQTLRAQGLLLELFAAVEEEQELQGKVPEVEAKRQAFERVIEGWLRSFPFKGHQRYSGFRVLTNDWTPGKTNAYIQVVLETRDAATNTYHRLRVRLTIRSRSRQVADYEVLGEA